MDGTNPLLKLVVYPHVSTFGGKSDDTESLLTESSQVTQVIVCTELGTPSPRGQFKGNVRVKFYHWVVVNAAAGSCAVIGNSVSGDYTQDSQGWGNPFGGVGCDGKLLIVYGFYLAGKGPGIVKDDTEGTGLVCGYPLTNFGQCPVSDTGG